MSSNRRFFDVLPFVAAAMKKNMPIVALESTVISHGGLGFPRNLETALALEDVVRQAGAVPATIAVMHNRVRVGLTSDHLELLARAKNVTKCTTRDLASCVVGNKMGSTTVAATMKIAHEVGISVFATGGVGGVHRGAFSGADPTLDVSADLTELGRTPVTVVCAGIKSILDVPATLEYLETMGVTVATLGPDGSLFPNFFSSGTLASPMCVHNASEVAKIMIAARDLNINSGMLLAVPPPKPIPDIEKAIAQALEDAKNAKPEDVAGKAATPFLLKRVGTLTEGKSVESNIELLKRNAETAARIAVQYAKLTMKP